MRYRLMATYLGVPYHAGLGPDGSEATLFSPGPPPDELGFTAAGGHWRKQVNVTDLDALWRSRLVGEYRGEPCLVLDDLGDRLHIVYLGRDSARARQLGYWEIDREVFEVVAARQDIAGLTEERVEYPLASAMFPPSNRDPAAQARPEAPGRGRSGRRRFAALGRRADQPATGGAAAGAAARRRTGRQARAGRKRRARLHRARLHQAPRRRARTAGAEPGRKRRAWIRRTWIRRGGPPVEYPGPDGGLARIARDRALVRAPAGPPTGSPA